VDERILNEMIPPLTLQPIVEDAIKHGIEDMVMVSIVNISIQDIGT
jgi:two-component system sensor histidine kinase LytS